LVQEEFAKLVGLSGKNLSLRWRQTMDRYGCDTVDRRRHARVLLASAAVDASYQNLIDSDEAMSLICEEVSVIRVEGDEVAHPSHGIPSNDLMLLRVLAAQIPERQVGLVAIIDFLLVRQHT
jgi:hypothetical protein